MVDCDIISRSSPDSVRLTVERVERLVPETGGDSNDCETVGIPPLMSSRTLGILDGGRGGAVDRARRRRGITGDKGGA